MTKENAKKSWATIKELARYEDEGWNDPIVLKKEGLNYENPDLKQLLGIMECKVGTLMEEAITLMRRSESIFGILSDMMHQLPPEPSCQEAFKDLVMNLILEQEEKVKQLEEYMENSDPQNTPQVLPSFEEYTPLVTYPEEVEKTLGTPIEVEPLDETQLEDLGLNTYNHDIPLSSREVPSFDKMKPQPQPLPNCPPLDISLGDKRGLEPPIKPHSSDNFRMKEVDHLTNHTQPSPHVTSFHPKDTYCYYHPCIGDPKKHYGFKPGLLEHSGSLGVDFLKLEMIENDLELESKEVYFLGRGLNSPVRPTEVENVRIKETRHLEHIIQQPIFQHITPSHNNGVYRYYHPHLNSSVGEPSPLSVE
ncbi:hypothetical protein Tco_1201131 [Tanacetum coccineum]